MGARRFGQTDEGVYSFDREAHPGKYQLVAVENLPESQRRDGRVAERFLSDATAIQLSGGEGKVEELRVQPPNRR